MGGLAVADGDLVVADEDGVAVIPRERVQEILTAAELKKAGELADRTAIANGSWNRRWLDDALVVR
jgi:regulator of RNase E activity RraA